MKAGKDYNIFLIYVYCLILAACTGTPSTEEIKNFDNPFLNRVLNNSSDYYYFDFKHNTNLSHDLPIGIFDSGTGGLTVLNAIINSDCYDNSDQKLLNNGDGIRDFETEEFIYLGDQANMPYGIYPGMNNTGYLKELILKDALFLLGTKYYQSPYDQSFKKNKLTVKLIVIACNTATAFGKNDIKNMLSAAGSNIHVIGVIDAGVKGALETFAKDENGTIAVLATAGTVSSNGYLNAFNKLKTGNGYSDNINFIQQSGTGIAESIDEDHSFITRGLSKIRSDYKGPALDNTDLKIRRELLDIYNFDTLNYSLLYEFSSDQYSAIQLNSPENYMKYYLVTLCEKLRKSNSRPLKTLILGCTHYPYLNSFIQKSLKELSNLKIDEKYIYKEFLGDTINIIDPAINTASEVYEYLTDNKLLNENGKIHQSQFYISVPDYLNSAIKIDTQKRFTFDYKYGRSENHFYDTKQVPFSRLNTNDEIISRIQKHIPEVFELMKKFNSENEITAFLKPDERF
jgi:glutamate racemase